MSHGQALAYDNHTNEPSYIYYTSNYAGANYLIKRSHNGHITGWAVDQQFKPLSNNLTCELNAAGDLLKASETSSQAVVTFEIRHGIAYIHLITSDPKITKTSSANFETKIRYACEQVRGDAHKLYANLLQTRSGFASGIYETVTTVTLSSSLNLQSSASQSSSRGPILSTLSTHQGASVQTVLIPPPKSFTKPFFQC